MLGLAHRTFATDHRHADRGASTEKRERTRPNHHAPVPGVAPDPTGISSEPDDVGTVSQGDRVMAVHDLPTCPLAAATTASTVKPKCFIKSLSGAEAPNVRMPIIWPVLPR